MPSNFKGLAKLFILKYLCFGICVECSCQVKHFPSLAKLSLLPTNSGDVTVKRFPEIDDAIKDAIKASFFVLWCVAIISLSRAAGSDVCFLRKNPYCEGPNVIIFRLLRSIIEQSIFGKTECIVQSFY